MAASPAPGSPAGDGTSGPRAADLFDARLAPGPGGRVRHLARLAGAVVAELLLQVIPSPSVYDVVVTRRVDGAEVARIPTTHPFQAGDTLQRIRAELAELDPETFLAQWTPRSPRKG